MPIYGLTQHAGLAENVLDHRLNCRTVYMNPVNRYLYWNMNYHVEHHMFPLVPYHALPRLHAAVKDDCPTPYAEPLQRLARDRSYAAEAGERSRLPRQAPAARAQAARARSVLYVRGCIPTPKAGLRFAQLPNCGAPMRSASTTPEKLTLSTATKTASSTPPTASAPTATPISPTAW